MIWFTQSRNSYIPNSSLTRGGNVDNGEPHACRKRLSFGPFDLAGPSGPLLKNGHHVPLRPKSSKLLWLLGAQAGKPVSKEELFQGVWSSKAVTDTSLAVCIREIRNALEDDAKQPLYIQTLHGHGYCFIGSRNTQALDRGRTFVGRKPELEHLNAQWALSNSARCQTVFVYGEAGIGKSTLLNTWLSSVGEKDNPMVLRGNCVDLASGAEAFAPFFGAIQSQFADPKRDNLIELMINTAPDWLRNLTSFLSPEQQAALSMPKAQGDAAAMRRQFAELLLALCKDRPIILVLDDMQWCDPSSLAMLSFIARSKIPGPLLLIVCYRHGAVLDDGKSMAQLHFSLKHQGYCTGLHVGPLAVDDVGAYLNAVLPDASSAKLALAMHSHTEGHPLFVTALCEHLSDQSQSISDADIADSLPGDLRSFIELRVLEMNDVERQIIRIASLAGKRFTTAELEDALPTDVAQERIEATCQTLCQQYQFIEEDDFEVWPDGTLTARYRFRHALYPQAIETTLSAVERARAYKAIARRLERGYAKNTADVALKIASHFALAKEAVRAVPYLKQAALAAQERNGFEEAELHLTRALDLLDDINLGDAAPALRLDLLLALGPVQVVTKGYGSDTVEALFSKARRLCALPVLAAHRLPVLRGLAGFYLLRGKLETARTVGAEILDLVDTGAMPNNSQKVEGHMVCSFAELLSGRPQLSSWHSEQVQNVFDPNQHASLVQLSGLDAGIIALNYTSINLWLQGDAVKAEALARQALARAEHVCHLFTLAQCHSFLALFYQLNEDASSTKHHSEQALDLAVTHGFTYLIGAEQAKLGWVKTRTGHAAEGIAEYKEGMAAYAAAGGVGGMTIVKSMLIDALIREQRFDEAVEELASARAVMQQTGERVFQAELLRLDARLRHQKSHDQDMDTVVSLLSQAIEVAKEQGAVALVKRAKANLETLSDLSGAGEKIRTKEI